jgi:hypothetical protein
MNRKTALRVIEPKSIAFDMEEGLNFIRDMGQAAYAAAHAIDRTNSLRTVFEKLGLLISDKAEELEEQR